MVDVSRQLLGPGPLPVVEHPRNFVIADFNHDGRQDLFVAAHGYDAPPFSGEANVLLISNPDGTYTDRSSTIPQANDFSHSACAGDINGDGNLDVYVGNSDTSGPYFLLGAGDGTFTTAQSGLPAPIRSANESFDSCAIVDIDGDDFQDLVLGTNSRNGYFDSIILFGDGTGDFTRRPRSVLPAGPLGTRTWLVDIVPLDVDRDARPDLILLSGTSSGFFGLQVLINKGGGNFADETSARIGPSAVRLSGVGCIFIRLVDLDGDGWNDLYCDMPNWDQGAPRYWMNNGNGTWSPATMDQLPGKSSFGYMNPLDFDRDGRLDFVQIRHTPEGDVGYESFQNRTPRTVPSEPFISKATAGDAQAAISFTPPLASGASPITGYTATCALGTFGSGVKAAGGASPITVSGLSNGRTYACSVTATNAAGTSLPSRALSVRPLANSQPPATKPDLNQHGLTGSWYEAATSGQGVEVEVFANSSSGAGSTFVSWFTYDTVAGGAARQRWYTAQGPVVTGQPNAALTIYRNTGGNFNAPPATTAQAVGTATLSFDTCTSGQLAYAFTDGTGRSGTIPLTRLTQNVTCATTTSYPTNADFAFSGNWFGGAATSGQGFTVEVNPNSGALFAAWYTYQPSGTAAGAAGQRWYTAQAAFTPGLRTMPVTIYETTGGVFDTPPPPGQNTVPVGTGTMAFQNCSAATFSYNFTGGSSSGLSGTINLSRVGPLPPGCTS